MLFILAAMILPAFVACDNGDTPDISDPGGKELAEWIKSCVLDEKGEISFIKVNDVEGVYVIPSATSENAAWFVEDLTRCNLEGEGQTVTLGRYGSLRITGAEKEGVYHTIVFNVKDIPPFTLEVCTPEYFDRDNSYGLLVSELIFRGRNYFVCENCLIISRLSESVDGCCPRCGFSYEGLESGLDAASFGDLYCVTPLTKQGYVVPWENSTEKDRERCVGMVIYAGHHPNDRSDYSGTGIGRKQCHGYAVALKYYHLLSYTSIIWGPNGNGLHLFPDYPWEERESPGQYVGRDWSGYLYTTKIIEKAGGRDKLIDNYSYPAAKRCIQGDSPKNSSGWFLPAMGQLKEAFLSYEAITARGGQDFSEGSGYWSSNAHGVCDNAYLSEQVYYLRWWGLTDHGYVILSDNPEYDINMRIRPVIAF